MGLAVSFPRAQDGPAEADKASDNAKSDATKPAAGYIRPDDDTPDIKEIPADRPAKPDVKGKPDPTSAKDDEAPTVFRLKHAAASAVAASLMDLYPAFKNNQASIIAESSNNTLVVKGPKALLWGIQELVPFLDELKGTKQDAIPGADKKFFRGGNSGVGRGTPGSKKVPGVGKKSNAEGEAFNGPKPGPPIGTAAPKTERSDEKGQTGPGWATRT